MRSPSILVHIWNWITSAFVDCDPMRLRRRLRGHLKYPVLLTAEKAGYIIFKDRAIVTFYSNDLTDTPQNRLNDSKDPHTVGCVHGIAALPRWIWTESLNRTTLQVPALVLAYTLFMNGVDLVDQMLSSKPMTRKELRVTIRLFAFIIDCAIDNSFWLYKVINPNDDFESMFTFKIISSESLVKPF